MDTKVLTPTELERIAGPLLIAYLLNWGLFGVLSLQVYLYYLAFSNDRIGFKVIVYGTYLLDATQTFLFTRSAFRTFASGFGDPAVLDEVDILWFSPILSGLVGFISQALYAYRIAIFSQKQILAGLILLLAVPSFGGSIAIGVETKSIALFSHFVSTKSLITAGIWEGGSALCDVLIAASMTYYLKRQDSEFKRTRVLLSSIIRLTIETGSLTAAIAILSLILVFLPGKPTYYQTSVAVLGKVYSNSMMVLLNSRMRIRGSNDPSISTFEVPIISNGATMRFSVDVERPDCSLQGGILITREEVSFPPSKKMSREAINGPTDYPDDPV